MSTWEYIVGIASIAGFGLGLFPVLKWYIRRPYRKYYDVIWKRSSALKPHDLLQLRANPGSGYRDFYAFRDIDNNVEKRLKDDQHILIVGSPLAGKTRAVFENLKRHKKRFDVLIPKVVKSYDIDKFKIPLQFFPRRPRVVIFDDIDKFISADSFNYIFKEFAKQEILLIATCRSGEEYDAFCCSLEKEFHLFGKPLIIEKIDKQKAIEVAKRASRAISQSFDGNIGSIFVPLDAIKLKYKQCSTEEKGILTSVKRLYLAGIYTGREIFNEDRIKIVAEKLEVINLKPHEWRDLIGHLVSIGFLIKLKEGLVVEEAYFKYVIEVDIPIIDNFQAMFKVFKDDPDAMFILANRANDIAEYSLDKVILEKMAIGAYLILLQSFLFEENPERFAVLQIFLGNAFGKLAEVEDKSANCRNAIEAYNNALRVYSYEFFPMDFAVTQNNLGAAYGRLAEVENKSENCKKAIEAFTQALQIRTYESLPMDYAETQNNQGYTYTTLADDEDHLVNCQKAIEAFIQALRVYTYESFPIEYAMTQNNLGNAYNKLAEAENWTINCRKAIDAYTQALLVYQYISFPIQYAITQNNLGAAYITLAKFEEKAVNCRKAIDAYTQALRINTYEYFPIQYAMTKYNLGIVYVILAEIVDKEKNIKRAIVAYNEAFKVYEEQGLIQSMNNAKHNLQILINKFPELQ